MEALQKMKQLRDELLHARKLVSDVRQRERLKRELLVVGQDAFEQVDTDAVQCCVLLWTTVAAMAAPADRRGGKSFKHVRCVTPHSTIFAVAQCARQEVQEALGNVSRKPETLQRVCVLHGCFSLHRAAGLARCHTHAHTHRHTQAV